MAVTIHFSLILPTVGGSVNEWGGNLNTNLNDIDTAMFDNQTVANWAKDTIQGALSPDYDWESDGDLLTRLDAVELLAVDALPKSGDDGGGEGEMTGRVDVLTSTTKYEDLGSVNNIVAMDETLGNYFRMTLSENVDSIAFDALAAVAGYVQIFILDITSAGFIFETGAWDDLGTVLWAYGVEPTLSTSGGRDIITLVTLDGGATWTAALAQPDCQ